MTLLAVLMLGACGGTVDEGMPGSACTSSSECSCWDCFCTDGVATSTINGRACDTTTGVCTDGLSACAALCQINNDTSLGYAAGNDCGP
jgi:hypothetical protein